MNVQLRCIESGSIRKKPIESANYISLAVSKLRANASNRTCIPCKTDEIPKIFSR